jgi:hypothetical protein
MIYKTMHWKLNTEQHEINTNWRWNQVFLKYWQSTTT